MFILAAYDIHEDRRRSAIFRLMKKYGLRVQLSVFEGDLTETQVSALVREAKEFIDESTDSLRIYLLCTLCRDRTRIVGTGTISEFPPAVVV